MAKQFKVLVNTGNAQSNQVLDVTQGQGANGQPLGRSERKDSHNKRGGDGGCQ